MSGVESTVDSLHDRVDEPEVDDGKRECLNDWCNRRIGKQGYAQHVHSCEPPANWDGGEA